MIERYETDERVEGELLCLPGGRYSREDGPFNLAVALGHGPVVRNPGGEYAIHVYEDGYHDADVSAVVDRVELLSNTPACCMLRVWLTRPLQGPLRANYTYATGGDTNDADEADDQKHYAIRLLKQVRERIALVDRTLLPIGALGPVLKSVEELEEQFNRLRVERDVALAASVNHLPDAVALNWREEMLSAALWVEQRAVKLWISGHQDQAAATLRTLAIQMREFAKKKGDA